MASVATQQDREHEHIPAGGHSDPGNENSQALRDEELEAHELQSTEQAQLLNAIDRLRRVHIDADISIPQIVVCGDQSSGKSSVLEAIARVPFPVDTRTTTRFATEVCLRHATTPGMHVEIIASKDRPEASRARIENFRASFEVSGPSDFGKLITEAREHLQALEPEKRFWKDKLRAEISGPDQPHLTLVDLPGIIHNDNNAVEGDKDNIKALVKEYLKDSRTVVLAVVNALVDEDGQEILSLIRKIATASERTIGVITKPDIPHQGSDQIKNVIKLAKNERDNYRLRLGWHVLKNLPHEAADRSFKTRDTVERAFFDAEPWTGLDPRDVGIENLRNKLKSVLFKAILTGLPSLKRELKQKRSDFQTALDRLGPRRDSNVEKRQYLSAILSKLKSLLEAGLKSDYSNTEFAGFCHRTSETALRDRINKLTDDFNDVLRLCGRQYHVYTEGVTEGGSVQRISSLPDLVHQPPTFFPPYTIGPFPPYTIGPTETTSAGPNRFNVSMKDYCAALSEHMDLTRGENLRGDISTHTWDTVFRQQSVPWTHFAEQFGEKCHQATYEWFSIVLKHVSGEHVAEALQREHVRQDRANKYNLLQDKITEILWPFKAIRPRTHNPRFHRETTLRSIITQGDDGEPAKSFKQLAHTNKFDVRLVSAADLMDKAEVYYEIALDRFIDDMETLAIERCLLHDLPNMLDCSSMDDDQVSRIASETPEARDSRDRTQRQIDAIRSALETFGMYSDSTADTHQNITGTAGVAGLRAPQTPVVISGSSSDNPSDTPPEEHARNRSSIRGHPPAQQPAAGTTSNGSNNRTYGPFGSIAPGLIGPNWANALAYRAVSPSPSPGNRASSAHRPEQASVGGTSPRASGGRSASSSRITFDGSVFGAGIPAGSVHMFGASPSFSATTNAVPTQQPQQP